MKLISVPIRRIGFQANLLLGAERRLILLLISSVVLIVNNIPTLIGISLAAVLFGVGLIAFRMMAIKDPFLSEIYISHIKLRPYYPARATPFCTAQCKSS